MGRYFFVGRHMLEGNHFQMSTSDVVAEFFLHRQKELVAVRLTKGMSKSHGVWVRGNECERVFAKQSHGVMFGVILMGGL